jgi:hypothetical protein
VSAQPYQYAQQPAATPATGGRGLIVAGIVSAAIGLVVAVVSFVLLVSGVVGAVGDQLTAPVFDGQGSTVLTLESGSYLLFQSDDTALVGVADVSVAGPDGLSVPVTATALDEEFTRGGSRFVAVARFDAPSAGDYTVSVAATDFGGRYVVAPGLASAVTDRAWWTLGIIAGGLLVVLGIVLLAVGLTRRRRGRAPAMAVGAYPTGPPPGWYPDPDPSRPGGRRYWDGYAWTGHIA